MQYLTAANSFSLNMEITFQIQTCHLFYRGINTLKSDSSLHYCLKVNISKWNYFESDFGECHLGFHQTSTASLCYTMKTFYKHPTIHLITDILRDNVLNSQTSTPSPSRGFSTACIPTHTELVSDGNQADQLPSIPIL